MSAGALSEYYEELHGATVARRGGRCQPDTRFVSPSGQRVQHPDTRGPAQRQTAPTDADCTLLAYLASTPRV